MTALEMIHDWQGTQNRIRNLKLMIRACEAELRPELREEYQQEMLKIDDLRRDAGQEYTRLKEKDLRKYGCPTIATSLYEVKISYWLVDLQYGLLIRLGCEPADFRGVLASANDSEF